MPRTHQTSLAVVPVQNRAEAHRLGYVGKKPSGQKRDADSWFTPPEYLDSVRSVIGPIGLDPFSSVVANEVVRAKNIFTQDTSAFDNEWMLDSGEGVFMNPPYSAGLCARAVNRFIDQFETGNFLEGIVLVNNATDTRWFTSLVARCSAACFTNHRISFWNSDKKHVSGNTRGQVFLYFGNRANEFGRVFLKHGFVMGPLADF